MQFKIERIFTFYFEYCSKIGDPFSYSFNATREIGVEMIGFLFAGGVTVRVDNVKLTYIAPSTTNFLADIRQSTDYSPFGVKLHNRDLRLASTSGTFAPYRYGFQNQEADDEMKGEGNSINFMFRMHDPRLGRFFAIDPLIKKYPSYTSYSFSGNRV